MSSPESTRSSVDLPAPFGPTSATVSPAATSSDTPSSSALPPARTVMPLADDHAHPTSARWRSSNDRKNGAPIAAVTMPIGSSAGAATMRAKVSATSSRIAPRQQRGRQQQAMARPDHEAQQMRHHDADKADHAGDRDGRPGRGRDQHDRDALQPLDRDAHVERFCFAEHDQVEPARDERQAAEQQHDERRNRRDLGPGGAAERAEQPEGDVAQLPVVGEKDEKPDPRIGERRDRDAGEQQDRDRGAAGARREAIEA